MNKNTITFEGETIDIGPVPMAVRVCGFANAAAVKRAAIKYSQGEPVVNMADVVEWFKEHR